MEIDQEDRIFTFEAQIHELDTHDDDFRVIEEKGIILKLKTLS